MPELQSPISAPPWALESCILILNTATNHFPPGLAGVNHHLSILPYSRVVTLQSAVSLRVAHCSGIWSSQLILENSALSSARMLSPSRPAPSLDLELQ